MKLMKLTKWQVLAILCLVFAAVLLISGKLFAAGMVGLVAYFWYLTRSWWV